MKHQRKDNAGTKTKSLRRKLGVSFLVIGTISCALAGLLLSYNAYENACAKQASSVMVDTLVQDINDPSYVGFEAGIMIEGRLCAGYLEIPSLDIKLPVLAEWNFEDLSLAPCCYSGSPAKGDFVIAAHNYTSHFGRLPELNENDRVVFVDTKGVSKDYLVKQIEEVSPTQTKEVIESNWDLTLFTCNYDGSMRFVVRCMLDG